MEAKLISGVFEIDGQVVTVGSSGPGGFPAPVNASLYDEAGWSFEMEYSCVRSKAIDEYLAIAAVGDEFQQLQARTSPRWFAMFAPGRDYTREERILISRNYNQDGGGKSFASGWTGALIMDPFYPDIKRDETDTRPPFSYELGEALEGFATPIFGFNIYDIHKYLVDKQIKRMTQGVEISRREAEFAANNPNAVRPGR